MVPATKPKIPHNILDKPAEQAYNKSRHKENKYMSTEVLTRPIEEDDILTVVDTLPSHEEDVSLIDLETAGVKVCEEFEKLWQLYEGRRAGLSFDFPTERVEFDVMATRYFHGEAIEEMYSRSRVYGLASRGEGRAKETVTIHVTTDQGEHEIYVDESGQLVVRDRDTDTNDWRDVTGEAKAKSYLDEFFHRTMDAASIHGDRDSEDRQRADASALGLLYARHPEFADRRSAMTD